MVLVYMCRSTGYKIAHYIVVIKKKQVISYCVTHFGVHASVFYGSLDATSESTVLSITSTAVSFQHQLNLSA